VVAAHYRKDCLLNCWTSSSDISGYHADFHEGHGIVGAWQGRGMDTACYVWIGLYTPSVLHGSKMGSISLTLKEEAVWEQSEKY